MPSSHSFNDHKSKAAAIESGLLNKLPLHLDHLYQICDLTGVAVFVSDAERNGKLVGCNEAACRQYGYSRREMLSLNAVDFDTGLSTDWYACFSELKRKNHPVKFKGVHKRKDRSTFSVELIATLFEQHEANYILTTVLDTSEIKRRKTCRTPNEEKYRKLFNLGSDAIFLIESKTCKILEANRSAETIYGYSRHELLMMLNTDLSVEPEKTREATRKGIQAIPLRYHRKKDGTIFPVEITASLEKWPDKHVYLASVRDISFRLKLEQDKENFAKRLQHAQKMEAISTLAGGIAHDFNNILSSVIGFSELALDEAEKDSLLQDSIREILAAGYRAKDLVQQILTFARKKDGHFKPVQPRLIIKEAVKFLRSSLPNIDIHTNIQCEDVILADPAQIHQAFINLCTNAAQAMEHSTTRILNISLTSVDNEGNGNGPLRHKKPGKYLKLSVSDTGTGIPETVLPNIFEPYFTTREPGDGAGLGLAVVHGITEACGGEVAVSTQPGQGTTFDLYFSIIPKKDNPDLNSPLDLPTGHERILLLDDEIPIVRLGKQILEKMGYSVIIATDAPDALRLFQNTPENFDLVITDLFMPKLTGDQFAAAVMGIRPDIPVILCTGFSRQISEEKAAGIGIKALIEKPFGKKDMAMIVRAVLDKEKE